MYQTCYDLRILFVRLPIQVVIKLFGFFDMVRIDHDHRDTFLDQPRCKIEPVVPGGFHTDHDLMQVVCLPDRHHPFLCQHKTGLVICEFKCFPGEFSASVVKSPDVMLFTPDICSDD